MLRVKDILGDVDVEPLGSQVYRRTKSAAKQSSRAHIAPLSKIFSPSAEQNSTGNESINPRRSNKKHFSTPLQDPGRPSSAEGASMEFSAVYEAGPSKHPSIEESPKYPQGRPEHVEDVARGIAVKYTPVTRRVSKAKKGVPVHICDICQPVKRFTRAEHLRRHKLSHQKPAFTCSIGDCERAFHRPDLLSRHIQRHEMQVEKSSMSERLRSRESSTALESRHGLSVKIDSQFPGDSSAADTSPADTITPCGISSSINTIKDLSFLASNFSSDPGPNPDPGRDHFHPQPSIQYRNSESEPYSLVTQISPISRKMHLGQQTFDDAYIETSMPPFPTYPVTPQLPLLGIPDDSWDQNLSYGTSLCSSASDSIYSDVSRTGLRLAHNDCSTSADWPLTAPPSYWNSHGSTGPLEDVVPEPSLDRYESAFPSTRLTQVSSLTRLTDDALFGAFSIEPYHQQHQCDLLLQSLTFAEE